MLDGEGKKNLVSAPSARKNIEEWERRHEQGGRSSVLWSW